MTTGKPIPRLSERLNADMETLRHENAALRPRRFAHAVHEVPDSSVIDWYDEHGETMSIERWTNPAHRTLQYAAETLPGHDEPNRILLVVHGNERPIDVTLPRVDDLDMAIGRIGNFLKSYRQ